MSTNVYRYNTYYSDLSNDAAWIELYPRLLSIARRFVYMYRVPCWLGQEEDLAGDVAQETVRRIIDRSQKATRGEATFIDSVENMMVVIALNYIKDLRRRDQRVIRISSDVDSNVIGANGYTQVNLSELATEEVYLEWLFFLLAHEIADFPCKQRKALLIDLANRMRFDTEPTPLQMAFLAVGIELQRYQQPLTDDPVERSRLTSLLCQAYKRLAQLGIEQYYVLIA